jgi:hypothetical protein
MTTKMRLSLLQIFLSVSLICLCSVDSNAYAQLECTQASDTFSSQSHLTDLQKADFEKSYKGTQVSWNVEIVEVSEKWFGGYKVAFKCIGSKSFAMDGMIEVSKKRKAEVTKLNKGDYWVASGEFTGSALGFVYLKES